MSLRQRFDTVDHLRLEVEQAPTGLVNLVQNPSGELGTYGWITPISNSTVESIPGYGLKFKTTTGGAVYFASEDFALSAGQYVAARLETIKDFGFQSIKMRFEFWNAAGTQLTSSSQTSAFVMTSSFVEHVASAVAAPSGTVRARLRIDMYANDGSSNPPALAAFTFKNVTVAKAATAGEIGQVRTNLVKNPAFETDINGWENRANASLARVTGGAVPGTYCLQMTALTSTPYTEVQQAALGTSAIPINGGADLSLQAKFWPSAARNVALGVGFWRADGSPLYASFGVGGANTGQWNQFHYVHTPPSDAAYARVIFSFHNALAGETLKIDQVMLEQTSSTFPVYFDGDTTDAGGITYDWTGTAGNSFSTASQGFLAYIEPSLWTNVLGPSHDISIDRDSLNLGTMNATILDAELDPSQTPSGWAATSVYGVGQIVILPSQEVLQATYAGTSGSTTPTAPGTIGGTVTDGTVVWKRISWTPLIRPGRRVRLVAPRIVPTPLAPYTNLALNPEPVTDLTGWAGGDTMYRIYEDGRWRALALGGTSYAYAQATGVVGHYYSARMRIKGAPGTTYTVESTDNVTGAWVIPLDGVTARTIPADGEDVVEFKSSAAVAGTVLQFGVRYPSANVSMTNAEVGETALGSALIPLGDHVDWEPIFTGRVLNGAVTYDLKQQDETKRARIVMTATDNISILAQHKRPQGVGTIDDLRWVLEGAGTPYNVNGSGAQLNADPAIVSTNDNATALDQVAITRDSQRGYAWVDRKNVLQVWNTLATSTPRFNMDFESGISGWTGLNGTVLSWSTGLDHYTGAGALRMNRPDSGAADVSRAQSAAFAANPGKVHTFTARSTASGNAQINIKWYNAANTELLSESSSAQYSGGSSNYVLSTVASLAPITAAYGKLTIEAVSTPVGYNSYVDTITAFVHDIEYLDDNDLTNIEIDYDTARCINTVTVKKLEYAAGETKEVVYGPYVDQTSIDTWGPHSAEFTVHGSVVPLTFATAILAAQSTPTIRVNSATLTITEEDEFTTEALIDLNDLVVVQNTSSGLDMDLRVTAIQHRITPKKWLINLGFDSPTGVAAPQIYPPVQNSTADGWIAPTMSNGWVNYGAPWETAGYRKINGIVYIRGLIRNGNPQNSLVFTLPAGYRPSSDMHIPAMGQNSTFAAFNIFANGQVQVNANASGGAGSGYVSLRLTPFPAEQ